MTDKPPDLSHFDFLILPWGVGLNSQSKKIDCTLDSPWPIQCNTSLRRPFRELPALVPNYILIGIHCSLPPLLHPPPPFLFALSDSSLLVTRQNEIWYWAFSENIWCCHTSLNITMTFSLLGMSCLYLLNEILPLPPCSGQSQCFYKSAPQINPYK